MAAACWFEHKWDGCQCVRCGFAREHDHRWHGCLCERCGKIRSEGHDWELSGCNLSCRICRLPGIEEHDWDGCRCTRCSTLRHSWQAGRCTRCDAVCSHTRIKEVLESFGEMDSETFHGTLKKICGDCGIDLRELWRK